MPFGEQLARLRERRQMSQVGLARRAALSQSTISKLEAGVRNPSLATMRCLAAGFGLSLAQFIRALEREAPRSSRR